MTDPCVNVTPGVGGQQTDLQPVVTNQVSSLWLTQHQLSQAANICQLGMSNAVVQSLLMQLLRSHFGSADLIMQPSLKTRIWTSDVTTSGIRLATATQFDPAAGQLPAVVIKRGDQTTQRMVVNDLNDGDPGWAGTGEAQYVRMQQGQHKLYCVGETDGEAEDLGTEVFEFLSYLSPVMRQLPFQDFQVTAIGELGVIDGLGNRIGVPVTISYMYPLSWTVKPVAPAVKTISIKDGP